MKTEKRTKKGKNEEKAKMKKAGMFLFGIILAILILPMFSATIEFWQQKYRFNQSVQNHLVFFYLSKTEFNYVTKGNPLEIYITYSMYPKTWNEDNPNYKVSSCNLSVYYSSSLENQSQYIFSHIVASSDEDIMNGKYFVRLANEDDGLVADLRCDFLGNVPEGLETPESLVVFTPTWECKACQMYDWNVAWIDEQKSNQLRTSSTSVLDYIRQLILSLYEILLAFFWIFMILMLFSAIALIFIGIYWLYLYLVKLAR